MSFARDMMTSTQGRLADLGYYTGTVDGLAGPMTRNAMVDFKRAHGLRARPFPGEITMGALWSPDAKPRPVLPPRPGGRALAEARRLMGVREVPGPASNPVIMGWARDLDQWYPGDDVPWCGLFMAHCQRAGNPKSPQDFNRLGARQWLKFGVEADADTPPLGSVCVLWRTHPTRSWHGHVFLVTGVSNTAIRGIGGNQKDAVSEMWFDRDRVLGIRVPVGFDAPPAPRAATGVLSTNEA